jgi:thymidylate synthase (FAD)
MSFSQESQRYVNYSKKGGITFIKPSVLKDVEIPEYPEYIDITNLRFKPFKFLNSWYGAEQTYNELLNFKYKPEIAREVLPNACKTELMITTDEDYLVNHFLPLRTASTAHPDMQVLANMIKECFENQIRSKNDELK